MKEHIIWKRKPKPSDPIEINFKQAKQTLKQKFNQIAKHRTFNIIKTDIIGSKRKERLRDLKPYKYFILLPDDRLKLKWDIVIVCVLFLTFFITPYRIAFVETDSITWIIID